MSFPNLVPVPSLGLSLPSLPSYQKWALNRDTNSIVLIEFVYDKTPESSAQSQTSSISGDSINLLNTTLQQSSSLINTQLSVLENRMNVLETLINSIVSPSNIINTGTI